MIKLEIELNNLVEHFASTLFKVRGIYRYNIPAGNKGVQKSASYPGFIFPLSGCAEYKFNNTPYLVSEGTVVHGLAGATMHKRVVGCENWEYISVLYETFNEPSKLNLARSHFSLTMRQSPQLLDLLHQLHVVSNRPGAFPEFQVETLFRRVLEEVFLCARNQTKHDAFELFETVADYIHTH